MVCPERSDVAWPQLGRPTVDEMTPTLLIEPFDSNWPFPWIADAVPGPSILPGDKDVGVEDRSFMEVLTSEGVALSPHRFPWIDASFVTKSN
jgi:hypothetical protein